MNEDRMDGKEEQLTEEPGCSCGHMHHHAHEDHHEHHSHKKEKISVHMHEGAAVGTVRTEVAYPLDIALKEIRRKFAGIAEQIEMAGGYIGHIKGIMEEDGRKCRISVVEAEERIDTEIIPPAEVCHVECVFIVFAIEPDALKDMLEKEFA